MSDEDVQAFIRYAGEFGEVLTAEEVREKYPGCCLLDARALWFNERTLPLCRETLNKLLAN